MVGGACALFPTIAYATRFSFMLNDHYIELFHEKKQMTRRRNLHRSTRQRIGENVSGSLNVFYVQIIKISAFSLWFG